MALSPTSSRSSGGGTGIPQGGPLTQDLAGGGFAITGLGDVALTGLTGATGAARLVGANSVGPPTTGTFAVGDVAVDQTYGKLVVCTVAGSPGTWRYADDPYGFPTTLADGAVADAASTLNSRIYASRCLGGGLISKLRIWVGNQSGNICVGVYRGSAVGITNNQPGTRLATSGSVACPATGIQDVSLTASVWVAPGDWLALMADNGTATFRAAGAGSGQATPWVTTGFTASGGTTLPLPSSLVLATWETKVYALVGVA